jgi:phosphoribosylamine--glycine ligase
MKVCVVGSGGREHALALALGRTADVVVAPGNPGIPGKTAEGHDISCSNEPSEQIDADLFVIGPEAPLVDGLADRLRAKGRLVFGPGADGAELEGSKAHMKQALAEAGIPTARYGAFTEASGAMGFLRTLPGPWVVKTDGLASGKGVLVATSIEEAERDIISKLSGESFGSAGTTVVIEEGLIGVECSVHVLCDGKRIVPLVTARDYKRIGDGDTGPNTGGMGAISPEPSVSDEILGKVLDQCVEPLVALLRKRGVDYRGVLFAGLMLTEEGPKVLEYNVRFGDPETQVITARTGGDFASLILATASGTLPPEPPVSEGMALCVVTAAEGYPGIVRSGDEIFGLEQAQQVPSVSLALAGVSHGPGPGPRPLVTSGGRVLGITAKGAMLDEARERAYAGVACVKWEGMQYRSDIGK